MNKYSATPILKKLFKMFIKTDFDGSRIISTPFLTRGCVSTYRVETIDIFVA